eukprot:316815_1
MAVNKTSTLEEILAIYVTCLYATFIPFYIYGLIKWYQFRRHFLIIKRFPMISNCIVVVTIISMNVQMVRVWYYNTPRVGGYNHTFLWGVFVSIPQCCSFLLFALVIYRVLLIYLRWKQYQIGSQTQHQQLPPHSP